MGFKTLYKFLSMGSRKMEYNFKNVHVDALKANGSFWYSFQWEYSNEIIFLHCNSSSLFCCAEFFKAQSDSFGKEKNSFIFSSNNQNIQMYWGPPEQLPLVSYMIPIVSY